MKRVIIATALLTVAVFGFGLDVTVSLETVYPARERSDVEDFIDFSSGIFEELFGDEHRLRPNGDYRIDVTVLMDESNLITFQLTSARGAEIGSPAIIQGQPDLRVAKLAASMWYGLLQQVEATPLLETPHFVYRVSTQYILDSVPGSLGYAYMASGLSASDSGRLFAGFSMFALELDEWANVETILAGDRIAANDYTYAYELGSTEGGTVVMKPSTGSYLYKVTSTSPDRSERLRNPTQSIGGMAVLDDGSVVLADNTQKRIYRIDGRRPMPLPIELNEYAWISVMAPGPDTTFYVPDNYGLISVYSEKGTLVDMIKPALGEHTMTIHGMHVYDDGSFILAGSIGINGTVRKFSPVGIPLWEINELPHGNVLPTNLKVAADGNGNIYLSAITMPGEIMRFVDPSIASRGLLRDVEERTRLARRLEYDYLDADSAMELGRLYEAESNYTLAWNYYDRAVDADPYLDEAYDKLDVIEASAHLRNARYLADQTRQIFADLGPANAEMRFGQAMQAYEKALGLNPSNAIRNEKDRFEDEIRGGGPGESARPPIDIIANVEIPSLFPSLIEYYRDNPPGTLALANTGDAAVEVSEVRVTIAKYMDTPSTLSRSVALPAGGESSLALPVNLNVSALELEENLRVDAVIEVDYQLGGTSYTQRKSVAVPLLRRTAISWIDTARLCSFITPREGVVTAFGRAALRNDAGDADEGIPEEMVRIIKMVEALGAHGMEYLEDPQSPITSVLGDAGAIDTVRVPRKTLLYRDGDCDDTSALLAALLESVGVKTGIMTSPGHVFMAASLGEPESNLWLYESPEFHAFTFGGEVWIPLETTVFAQGFEAVWSEATKLVRRWGDQVEFLATADAWNTYPSLPLAEDTDTVIGNPDTVEVSRRVQASLESTRDELVAAGVAKAEAAGGRSLDLRKAAVYGKFGQYRDAKRLYENILRRDPGMVAAIVGLSNIALLEGDEDAAKRHLEEGLADLGEVPTLLVALASLHKRLGEAGSALRVFRRIEEVSPRTAQRYSYLGEADGTARAGLDDAPMIWPEEEF